MQHSLFVLALSLPKITSPYNHILAKDIRRRGKEIGESKGHDRVEGALGTRRIFPTESQKSNHFSKNM